MRDPTRTAMTGAEKMVSHSNMFCLKAQMLI